MTPIQMRSMERRERLIAATATLLDGVPLEEITLAVVANRAGVPLGSTYHLYPKINHLLAAVIERLHDQFLILLMEPYARQKAKNWQSIIEESIQRRLQFYNQRTYARQLVLSDKSPPEIKHVERYNDHAIGQVMIDLIQKHFVLPNFSSRADVFFYSAKITSLFFTLSNIHHDKITENFCKEAKLAVVNYLRAHLPDDLPPAKSYQR
jgi:AcrR family transcriptional regulator